MSVLRPFALRPSSTRATVTRTVVWVSVAFAMLALSAPLQADAHRARLSRGLAEKVRAGQSRGVIVSGTREQILDLAARHGLTVEKTLETGAVLRVPDAESLARLAGDPGVPVVAEDAAVSAHMATEVAALGRGPGLGGAAGLAGRHR